MLKHTSCKRHVYEHRYQRLLLEMWGSSYFAKFIRRQFLTELGKLSEWLCNKMDILYHRAAKITGMLFLSHF